MSTFTFPADMTFLFTGPQAAQREEAFLAFAAGLRPRRGRKGGIQIRRSLVIRRAEPPAAVFKILSADSAE